MAENNRRADHIGPHRRTYDKNKAIILRTQNICGICGMPVDKSRKYPDPLSPCVDHIIPIARGGHPSAIENLQLAHWKCNRMKSDKLQNDEFKGSLTGTEEAVNNDLPWTIDWTKYRASDGSG